MQLWITNDGEQRKVDGVTMFEQVEDGYIVDFDDGTSAIVNDVWAGNP